MGAEGSQKYQPTPEEVARYNQSDWPGSEMFHPPHMRGLVSRVSEAVQAKRVAEQQPDIPINIVLGEN